LTSFSWLQASREAPLLEALRFEDNVWNFRDLGAEVERTSRRLAALGAGPGAAVALRAQNSLDALRIAAATIELQAPLVLLHPRLTQAEEGALLAQAQPRVLALEGEPRQTERFEPLPAEVGVVMFTSGTSGRPRGAMLPWGALSAAVEASAALLPVAPGDRWLLCLPLCHIGGLSILLRCLRGRGSVVLAPRFRAAEVLALIERHRPTLLSVVPTMLHDLLEVDERNLLATLRAVLVGGAAAPAPLLERSARRGVLALTTYGLTEACSQVTTQRPRDASTSEPGVGLPLPGVALRLVSEEGAEVRPGAIGRIQIQGPTLMRGYLGESPISGWFDTGDLGSFDLAGHLHVHARRSDLIVTGGENVYPAEVEAQLLVGGGVLAAMVFGVPDPRWGQLVAAAIVPAPGFNLEAWRAAVLAAMAPHKRPRLFCVTDGIPLGPTGKPLRRLALELFQKRLSLL
jgi:O-succinylbenzoic acid--CoA ligase